MKAAVLSLLVVLTSYAVSAADDWTGQRVVLKRPGVRLGHTANNGERTYLGEIIEPAVTVLGQRGDWLRVRQRGEEGWFPKAEAVPVGDAVAYFTEQLQNDPNNPAHYFRRAVAWEERGALDDALKDYSVAIRLDPNYTPAFNCRGIVWRMKGEYENALKDYAEAIRLDPKSAPAFSNRGIVWGQKGEYEKALKDFAEAIRLDPGYAPVFNNRGIVWLIKKEYDKALKDCTEAIRLDPYAVLAFYNRGNLWGKKGEYGKALEDYTEAIRLDPKDADVLSARAWLRATSADEKYRDGRAAVRDAKTACELTGWKTVYMIGTLAAAHAEAGDFDQAVRYIKRALVDKQYEKENGETGRKMLKLFEQKKPYRETPSADHYPK